MTKSFVEMTFVMAQMCHSAHDAPKFLVYIERMGIEGPEVRRRVAGLSSDSRHPPAAAGGHVVEPGPLPIEQGVVRRQGCEEIAMTRYQPAPLTADIRPGGADASIADSVAPSRAAVFAPMTPTRKAANGVCGTTVTRPGAVGSSGSATTHGNCDRGQPGRASAPASARVISSNCHAHTAARCRRCRVSATVQLLAIS